MWYRDGVHGQTHSLTLLQTIIFYCVIDYFYTKSSFFFVRKNWGGKNTCVVETEQSCDFGKCANTSLSGILSPWSQQYAVNSFSLAELLRLQNDIISIKWNLWKLAIYVVNSLLFSWGFKWKSATCFRVSVNRKSFIETFKL